jgi:hypothetical protein
MPEEQQPESIGLPQVKRPGGRRRGRRGGRGRSRGLRQSAPAAPVEEITEPAPAAQTFEQPAQAESPANQIEPPIRLQEKMPVRPAPSKQRIQPPVPAEVPAPVPAARAAKPEGSAIGQTVEEVRQIVESLEQALEQMEEVLRLVELAEHQKNADERELESLRRALHKLQPPHRERPAEGR